jgi:hypothetical protein
VYSGMFTSHLSERERVDTAQILRLRRAPAHIRLCFRIRSSTLDRIVVKSVFSHPELDSRPHRGEIGVFASGTRL